MQKSLSSQEFNDIFNNCGYHVVDDGTVMVYHKAEIEADDILRRCAHAEDSYARKVLNWPSGRLAKPTIFAKTTAISESLEACAAHFMDRLSRLLERASLDQDRILPEYPFAFVFVDQECPLDQVTVVLAVANEESGDWRLCPCRIPIEAELGSQLDSLRMSDVTGQDLAELYGVPSPLLTVESASTSIA